MFWTGKQIFLTFVSSERTRFPSIRHAPSGQSECELKLQIDESLRSFFFLMCGLIITPNLSLNYFECFT